MLGVPIGEGNSDSQDLNRMIETLCRRDGLSLAEAMEMVVPPIVAEIVALPEELHSFYMYLRQLMGPFAQGPVALIARHADECVFSADALGLRPLWQLETPDDFVFSSEPGVVSVEEHGLRAQADGARREVHGHDRPRQAPLVAAPPRGDAARGHEALAGPRRRRRDAPLQAELRATGGPLEGREVPGYSAAGPSDPVEVPERVLAGFGWQRDDVKLVQQMASNGAEPIGSLGYDGPLAALSPERQNLADYFKETVAVVTNPAIDREREIEHFSTRAIFGHRPAIGTPGTHSGIVATDVPCCSAATTRWPRSGTASTAA